MVIKEYNNANLFLNDCETYLLEHEAAGQLLLFSAYQNRHHNLPDEKMFGMVSEDGQPILLFCNIPPYSMVIYAVQQEKAPGASEFLGAYISEHHINICGIIARNEVCQSFIEKYKTLSSNRSFDHGLGMDIMEIRKVNDISPAAGIQRLAKPEEDKLITDWMIEFHMEALLSELDYEAVLNLVHNLIHEKKLYVFENEEKQMVTMASTVRQLPHGIAIAYVYTPESFRGKGYAATNMYYLSKQLLEQGNEYCTLYVDKSNPLSNRAYEKVGYKVLEDSYEYKLLPTEGF